MTRVRSLDGSPLFGAVTDALVRVDELAGIEVPFPRVIIVENEVTFLALPSVPGALAFFGAGFDVLRLGRIPWLRNRDVVYWGDLDTDGFVILDRLRGQLRDVRSVLMDLDTLKAHESQWTTDPTPVTRGPRAAHARRSGSPPGAVRQRAGDVGPAGAGAGELRPHRRRPRGCVDCARASRRLA